MFGRQHLKERWCTVGDSDKARSDELEKALETLRDAGIEPAVNCLPYCSQEGGYQFIHGAEVEVCDSMRDDHFPELTDEQWEQLACQLIVEGPFTPVPSDDEPHDT
jgi:hypothetical protein